ncbi:MAG: hypothetical protein WDN75_08335 [Bacteroidota bacterium]
MKADSAIYRKSYELVYGQDAAFSEYNAFTIGLSPGYTYTFVRKNFFANGSISVAPPFSQLTTLYKVFVGLPRKSTRLLILDSGSDITAKDFLVD